PSSTSLSSEMICCSLYFDFFIVELLWVKKLYFKLAQFKEETTVRTIVAKDYQSLNIFWVLRWIA
ncbi:MAG: hypothetical protein WAU15_02215, partial [Nitrosomonas sp.]